MQNETIGRIVGLFLGAALIIAGMAVFSPRRATFADPQLRSSVGLHDTSRYPNGD